MWEAFQAYDAVCVSGFVSTLTACHPNTIMAASSPSHMTDDKP